MRVQRRTTRASAALRRAAGTTVVGGLVLCALPLLVPGAAELEGQRREVAFDRPESWGMKYGSSLALFTGLGVPRSAESGSVRLGLEVAHVPELSDAQRRIGFDGTKLEDMNKTPVFARLRAGLGLGGGWGFDVGVVPPVEMGGATPLMASLAIGGELLATSTVRVGVRGFGHLGRIQGDFTCDAETVSAGVGSPANPFDCEEISEDELVQRVVGAEASVGFPVGRVEPYAAIGVNYLDTSFQVDARYSGVTSMERLETSGTTVSGSAGLVYDASDILRISGEVFYTPLEVVRPPAVTSGTDGLLNVRVLLSYRVR